MASVRGYATCCGAGAAGVQQRGLACRRGGRVHAAPRGGACPGAPHNDPQRGESSRDHCCAGNGGCFGGAADRVTDRVRVTMSGSIKGMPVLSVARPTEARRKKRPDHARLFFPLPHDLRND
eukprot:366528-Chlamydomonas_euryale.AAC.12